MQTSANPAAGAPQQQPQRRLYNTVVFTAPQAWGKTRQAQALMREFGCRTVVDDWWTPGRRLVPEALHLTNTPPSELKATARRVRVVVRGW